MRNFILTLPGKLQPIFVIGSTLALAFCSAGLCSLFFHAHQLVENTDLISSVYQVMGTIYGILLTFTLWGVWQCFCEAGMAVQNEAYSLLDLVHLSEMSLGKKNQNLRNAVLEYAEFVVQKEWDALKIFTNRSVNLCEIHQNLPTKIMQTVQAIIPESEKENTIFSQTLTLLTRWMDARRSRFLIARGGSVKALWPLLLTGAIVLFAFHGLFIAKTLTIWVLLLFGASLVISVTFYLIFSLDCPFTGTLSIDYEPFALIIAFLKSGTD